MAILTTGARQPGKGLTVRVMVAAVLGLIALSLHPGAAWATDFSNPAPITLPLGGPPAGCPFPKGCPSEKADLYPSPITVSGLTGTVADVKVTLHDLTYTLKPADADIMLVAPGGKAVMLMSDACGDNSDANANPITTPITLTFDDKAPSQLPADSRCSSGTFRPLDDDDDTDEFPLHMHPDDFFPDAPVQAPASTLPLSTFNGINPSGTWNLYVVDDFPNDPNPNGFAGKIAGGWSIDITTSGGTATTAAGTATTAPVANSPFVPANPTPTLPLGTVPTLSPGTIATVPGATNTVAGGSPTGIGGTLTPATGGAFSPATSATIAPATRAAPTFNSGATPGVTAGAAGQSSTAPATARTGSNSGPLSAFAAALIASGMMLVRTARNRRRPRQPQTYIVHYSL